MNNEINLDRFAELLNNQGNLREQCVREKLALRQEKARILREKKKRLAINPI